MGRTKGEAFSVRTLDECFASLEVAQRRHEAADARTKRSIAKVLGAIAEAAIDLGEREPARLRLYVTALGIAGSVRSGPDALPALAIARARLHQPGAATVLARASGESSSPVTYRLADASAPPEPLGESELLEQLRRGDCAYVRFNHSGRFAVEVLLTSGLDVDVGSPSSMSGPQTVHVPSGRLVLEGGRYEPDATLEVPIGWYDAVFCAFDGQRRVVVVLAPTAPRPNEAVVDVLTVRGLGSGD